MNGPNVITSIRVVLIPVFVWTLMTDTVSRWIPLAIYIVAGISDIVDGYWARKDNLVTDFGKLMDPLADKLLNSSAFILLTFFGVIHPVVTIIVIGRELLITGLRCISSSRGNIIAADVWGKAKTISQDFMIGWVLFADAVQIHSGTGETVTVILTAVMTALTVISAGNYILRNKEIFNNI